MAKTAECGGRGDELGLAIDLDTRWAATACAVAAMKNGTVVESLMGGAGFAPRSGTATAMAADPQRPDSSL